MSVRKMSLPFKFFFHPWASFDSQKVVKACLKGDWKVASGVLLPVSLN